MSASFDAIPQVCFQNDPLMKINTNFLLALGASIALGTVVACNDGVDTSEAVSNDIENAADRGANALGNAGDRIANAAGNAGDRIDAAADRLDYEWDTESRDLYGDMREARGYMDNRITELERDMESAGADAKMEMRREYDELKAASRRVGDDVDNWSDRVGNDFDRYSADTRSYLEGLDLDVDLDDDRRDFDYN